MSINEELITTSVPVAPSPARMSQQGVRESFQCAQLSFIALSTDVDDDALTAGLDAVVRNGHVHRVMAGALRAVGDFRLSQRRL